MSTPAVQRALGGIIITVVVLGLGYRKPLVQITLILLVKSIRRIFHMTCDEYLASVTGGNHKHSGLIGLREQLNLRMCQDILPAYLRVTAMWSIELIIKTAEYG